MKITLTRSRRGCRIRLAGDLTIYHAAAVQPRLLVALNSGRDVDVLLGEVGEVDSAGVQLLLALRREVDSLGRRCRLTGASAEVAARLSLLGLSGLLDAAA
jgi:anti-anti-sigma factor